MTANLKTWRVETREGVYYLMRRVECVVCCPRKRPNCAICHGTGIRDAGYEVRHEDLLELAKELVILLHSE